MVGDRLAAAREVLAVCLDALARRRLRSALAVTGVVIGVGTVTAMISVIEGARQEVLSQVSSLGLHNVVARPRSITPGTPAVISFEDIEKLQGLMPFAEAWSPLAQRWARIEGPRSTIEADVLGVGGRFARIMDLTTTEGRLLADLDLEKDARVAVLGPALARQLYGRTSAVGDVLTVEGTPYEVVGVLGWRSSPGTAGGTLSPRDLNKVMLVPVRRDAFFGVPVSAGELWVRMPADVPVDRGGAILTRALLDLHDGQPDVDVLVPLDVLRQRLRAQRTFAFVMGSVSLLALLGGGIGIMNLMLAAVLERTSEIGLRRSVGAPRRWILWQFLTESTVIAVAGGVIGILAGAAGSVLITQLAGWPTHVPLWGVATAAIVSVCVGVFFGTYPAIRAARLAPVDAVRYE